MKPALSRKKAKIFLIDDHPIVRQSLGMLIDRQADKAVCGEASSAPEALAGIEKSFPDLIVLDLSLPGQGGLELIKTLHARFEEIPILILSMHDESLYAARALQAGARGYIMKHETVSDILAAIDRILGGKVYLSERMSEQMLSLVAGGGRPAAASPLAGLTDRELEVFELLGRGLGTRTIAQKLSRSVKTIETHRANIKSKLQLKDSVQLMQHAVQWVQQPVGHER